MKKFFLTLALIITAATQLQAQTVEDFFNAFKDKPGVEYVNIPKAMLSMVASASEEQDAKDMMKKLESMTILEFENNPELQALFEKKMDEFADKAYEELISASEDGEKAKIYVKMKEGSETISDMVIMSIEKGECTLLQIKGELKVEDVDKLKALGD